jgi:hypothetical protein
MKQAPLSDDIVVVVSKLVDDAQSETREPSHSDIEFQINRADLKAGDPKQNGQVAGKAKRVRATLNWALDHNPLAGGILVASLISAIRGCGGFREESPNYVGRDAIANAAGAFKTEGFELASDGELRPLVLDQLAGAELTDALLSYVRRARRGASDAALVTGTGKDLLEATAAHVIKEKCGAYPQHENFPTLLGQAFVTLGLATPAEIALPNESTQKDVDRGLYQLGCAINRLRNKEGTGHGRPWLPSVTETEARIAVETMGLIAERLLAAFRSN